MSPRIIQITLLGRARPAGAPEGTNWSTRGSRIGSGTSPERSFARRLASVISAESVVCHAVVPATAGFPKVFYIFRVSFPRIPVFYINERRETPAHEQKSNKAKRKRRNPHADTTISKHIQLTTANPRRRNENTITCWRRKSSSELSV
jgi:hypothetical protein